MNDRFLRDVVEYIEEYIALYRKMFRQQFQGLHWGHRSITDEQHAQWFIMKVAENPNWILALPYVEGGMAELRRFERTMGALNETAV